MPYPLTLPPSALVDAQLRWPEVVAQEATALRVALLATYTIDPLLPYLGVLLNDAGRPAELTVGPINQIVQQCLDDTGTIAAAEPDILVVAPRFEELWQQAPITGAYHPATYRHDFDDLVETVLAAAEKWSAQLVFVLPPVPELRPLGVADDAALGGVLATATAVREALRARLAGAPRVAVVDLEQVIREIGAGAAYHPVLFAYAKVPYTDVVFGQLAERIVRSLHLYHAPARRAVVLDADSLLCGAPDNSRAVTALESLAPLLTQLRALGVRIGIVGSAPPGTVWQAIRKVEPHLGDDLIDADAVGGPDLAAQLADLADELEVPLGQVALVSADLKRLDALHCTDTPVLLVAVGEEPTKWPNEIQAAGVCDRLPADGATPGPTAAVRPTAAVSLEEFRASLHVEVTLDVATKDQVGKVEYLVERTKTFTLGVALSAAELARRCDDPAAELFTAHVQDRFGRYGITAAIATTVENRCCRVDLFLISCPVLGKGVEEQLVRKIIDWAEARGCTEVVFEYRNTGRNRSAVDFVHRLMATSVSIRCADIGTAAPSFADSATVGATIEAIARRSPDALAIDAPAGRLTYAQLLDWADAFGSRLRDEAGVPVGAAVGVHLDRDLALIPTLLALLRWGYTYVPLDPGYPADRLRMMAQDAGLAAIVSDAEPLPEPLTGVPALVRPGPPSDRPIPADRPAVEVADVAYLMFTSGSTGRPKGVVIEQGSLAALLAAMRTEVDLGPADRLLAVTPISFDISLLELLLPLVSGAAVVLAPGATTRDGAALLELALDKRVTYMQGTPATWRMLNAADQRRRLSLNALCGGDVLAPDLAAELRQRHRRVWNLYGPTEATIWASAAALHENPDDRITIGRALRSAELLVLDANRQPVSDGADGDLYIGGSTLARGYLHDPAMSADRFVVGPDGNRLYRTGDLVRRLADGRYQFLGRADGQVKVRGFRIETAEVEAAVRSTPGIADVAVVAAADNSGESSLVGYLVLGAGPAVSRFSLLQGLSRSLPAHMLPSRFLVVDALPLTPAGKVDRRALAGLPSTHLDQGLVTR